MVNVDDGYIKDLTSNLISRKLPISCIVSKTPYTNHDAEYIDSKQLLQSSYLTASMQNKYDFCLDENILKKLCECERIFLTTSDSLCLYSKTLRERKKLFRMLCQYWHQILSNKKIKFVFFPCAPEHGWDIVLFYMAKFLDIETIILVRTMIKDRVLLRNDFRSVNNVPKDFLLNKSAQEMEQSLDDELRTDLWSESSWTKQSKSKNSEVLANNNHFFNHLLYVFSGNKVSEMHLAMNGTMAKLASPLNYLYYVYRINQLRAYYDKHSRAVDYSRPYVYFALHCDPGRATQTEGGVFEDQYLAIKILSKSLPEGWQIYVKEHPRQFEISHLAIKQMHYRKLNDYEEINKLSNVNFINIEEKSDQIINDASLVATITGSVGWQALLAGKQCISFGVPWYASCNSCHIVKTLNDCSTAFGECVKSTLDDVKQDVLRFVHYLHPEMIVGSTRAVFAELSSRSYHELLTSLTDEFEKKNK